MIIKAYIEGRIEYEHARKFFTEGQQFGKIRKATARKQIAELKIARQSLHFLWVADRAKQLGLPPTCRVPR
jgi:hypothetical protein